MKIELLKSITGRVLVESHRGAEGLAPENSWTALKLGRDSGAAWGADHPVAHPGRPGDRAFRIPHPARVDPRRGSAAPIL